MLTPQPPCVKRTGAPSPHDASSFCRKASQPSRPDLAEENPGSGAELTESRGRKEGREGEGSLLRRGMTLPVFGFGRSGGFWGWTIRACIIMGMPFPNLASASNRGDNVCLRTWGRVPVIRLAPGRTAPLAFPNNPALRAEENSWDVICWLGGN